MNRVTLRPIADSDLDALYEQIRDPESVRMAAFTVPDPADRETFEGRMARAGGRPVTRTRGWR